MTSLESRHDPLKVLEGLPPLKNQYKILQFDGKKIAETNADNQGDLHKKTQQIEKDIRTGKTASRVNNQYPESVLLIITANGKLQIVIGDANQDLLQSLYNIRPELKNMNKREGPGHINPEARKKAA